MKRVSLQSRPPRALVTASWYVRACPCDQLKSVFDNSMLGDRMKHGAVAANVGVLRFRNKRGPEDELGTSK